MIQIYKYILYTYICTIPINNTYEFKKYFPVVNIFVPSKHQVINNNLSLMLLN